ncbi:cytochrome c3 family protein [Desulfitobacterium sp.]|uniref:cytochrome c3 family protein n=1 Tax=Desulfitobacterium sp. TaxID=49981 RepID=UPI002BE8FA3E|nr:cytochrome c3 family protein [Desulfitobacterium sp.]HVJ47741.1 cytochrome c3 family protein [Desulfitobacterium sp.]
MKKVKQIVLALAFTTLTSIVIAGCGTQQAAAPNDQSKQPAATQVAKATYVGTETCKACHADKVPDVAMTGHGKAFKPLSDFPTTQPLGEITIYDSANTEKAVSTKIDLSKAKVYGVMLNQYVVAEVPKEAGFKDPIYRVAKMEKSGDKYTVVAAGEKDMNKDGKSDWTASSFTCGKCHAPGIATNSPDSGTTTNSPDLGISCESCHGAGSIHVSAENKKGTLDVSSKSCVACHALEPAKDAKGNYTTQNHYGTRDFFASTHYESGIDCLSCHSSHKSNANGQLLKKDNPTEICATCHAGKSFDLKAMMWKNPTDAHGHITADHSFGAIKYADLGDDPATKELDIKNQKVLDIIQKNFPSK